MNMTNQSSWFLFSIWFEFVIYLFVREVKTPSDPPTLLSWEIQQQSRKWDQQLIINYCLKGQSDKNTRFLSGVLLWKITVFVLWLLMKLRFKSEDKWFFLQLETIKVVEDRTDLINTCSCWWCCCTVERFSLNLMNRWSIHSVFMILIRTHSCIQNVVQWTVLASGYRAQWSRTSAGQVTTWLFLPLHLWTWH